MAVAEPLPCSPSVLRITCTTWVGDSQRVRVEGRVAGEYVAELARVVTAAIDRPSRVVLELSDVTFIDQAGAALLRDLRERGVELAECSAFVETLVNGAAL